jgi:deoxyribonuclease V
MMIFAVDVDYRESSAISAGVMFQEWEESTPLSTLTVRVENIAEYEPGFFYKRELPCILQLLDRLDSLPTYIIIDGYVYLDNSQKPGLGKHLYDALEGRSIIIGAAKTRFIDTPHR